MVGLKPSERVGEFSLDTRTRLARELMSLGSLYCQSGGTAAKSDGRLLDLGGGELFGVDVDGKEMVIFGIAMDEELGGF